MQSSTELKKAIYKRRSVKRYKNTPLKQEDEQALSKLVEEINSLSHLNFQLIVDEPKVFKAFGNGSTGLISEQNYFALVGDKSINFFERQIGYWGQYLVLNATSLGFATNWTGGSRRLSVSSAKVEKGQKNAIIVAVGYESLAPNTRKEKDIESLCVLPPTMKSINEAPSWFIDGMNAVRKAPSGFNRQKYCFILNADNTVSYKRTSFLPLTECDLGIAIANFEIAAGSENFKWEKELFT